VVVGGAFADRERAEIRSGLIDHPLDDEAFLVNAPPLTLITSRSHQTVNLKSTPWSVDSH
jgi:hypothetical protein